MVNQQVVPDWYGFGWIELGTPFPRTIARIYAYMLSRIWFHSHHFKSDFIRFSLETSNPIHMYHISHPSTIKYNKKFKMGFLRDEFIAHLNISRERNLLGWEGVLDECQVWSYWTGHICDEPDAQEFLGGLIVFACVPSEETPAREDFYLKMCSP